MTVYLLIGYYESDGVRVSQVLKICSDQKVVEAMAKEWNGDPRTALQYRVDAWEVEDD